MQLGSMFTSNCNNILHVSDAFTTILSAPEGGRKKRPKHVEYYCSY